METLLTCKACSSLRMSILGVFVLSLLHHQAQALFSSSPSEISPGKTSQVTLRCDPDSHSVAAILAIHLKKKEDAPAPQLEGDEGKDNSESQTEGVSNVYGGDGDEGGGRRGYRRRRSADDDFVRATLTSGNNIDLVPSSERFAAEGDMSNPAHLSVTIDSPGTNDLGFYECQVTYLDLSGNIQVASEVAEVGEMVSLSLDSLEDRVLALEEKSLAHEQEARSVEEWKTRSHMMEDDVAALKEENKELVATIADLTGDLRELNEKFDALALKISAGAVEPGTPGGYGNEYASYNNRDNGYHGSAYRNRDDDGYQTQKDDLFKVNERMDELENTRIHVLEQQLHDLTHTHTEVESRVEQVETELKETVEHRIHDLEEMDFNGLSETVQDLEVRSIPVLSLNVSHLADSLHVFQKAFGFLLNHIEMDPKDVVELLTLLNTKTSTSSTDHQPAGLPGVEEEVGQTAGGGDQPQQPSPADMTTLAAAATTTSPVQTLADTQAVEKTLDLTSTPLMLEVPSTTLSPPTTMAEDVPKVTPYYGRACYVCGNNATQEACNTSNFKSIGHCPEEKPNCITDVYQDGMRRKIYRRCASVRDCQDGLQRSYGACETETFMYPTRLECHFCCTSVLCNDDFRPSRDAFKGT